MNSLPLYPISTFTADCEILLGAEREGGAGSRCRAVALGTPSPARPSGQPQCWSLLLSRGGDVTLRLRVRAFAVANWRSSNLVLCRCCHYTACD